MTDNLANTVKKVNTKRRRRRAAALIDSDDVYGWSVRMAPGKPPVAKWEMHADPLVSLVSVPGILAGIDRLVVGLVYELRAQDLSWGDVGSALQISRQAAQKRYGYVDQMLAEGLGSDEDDE